MIKSQQLSLRSDAARKLLGLPDTRAQRSQLKDADLQMKSMSSDKGTASESTTPNFAMESMEGNISQALQYLGIGCRDQALPLIRTAVERNPDLSTALIGMGQTLFSNRLFPEAAVCFEHAIPKIQEDDPLLVLAYFEAGLSNERQVE
ncbi:ALBINO3-like protein 3, mitochondrial [Miscanthus floridulus]|uniref:ALBINO3-like protein 3, mitochondrial n=1 Tax=Miscanthus floridulus TaxID=154761 RepID=UPI0034579F9A